MKSRPGSEKSGILVVQSLGLGDLIFAIPLLRVLKGAFPQEPLAFLTHARNAELLVLVPEVERVISYEKKTPATLLRLIQEARRGSYRMVFVLNPIFRGSVLAWCSGAPVRVGYRRDYERKQSLWGFGKYLLTHSFLPQDKKIHEVGRYLDLARMFGLEIRPEDAIPKLSLTPEAEAFGRGVARSLHGKAEEPLVALLPGGGWKMRWWPADRFAAVGDWLADACGARVLLLGSKGEAPLVEQIQGQMKRPVVSYAGKTTLVQLAGLLSQCDLLLSNDTGVAHLAAALNVPTLTLFGPGDPLKARPLSPRAVILHHPVPWGPCRVQYTDRCQNNLCMKELSVEEVQEAISKILGPPKRGLIPLDLAPFTPKGVRPLPVLKRILYLQSTSEISGTDITLLRMLEVLDRNRFEAHVALPREGPFADDYRKAGAKVYLLPAMRQLRARKGIGYLSGYVAGYPTAVWQISRLARREKIDLIHTNTIHNLHGFLAARLAGVPHIWHIREIVVQNRLLGAMETFLVKRFSTRFIVMNQVIAAGFTRRGGGLPANIAKLYDGVDLEEFHPEISGQRIRRELGINDSAPLIGTVCRLDPWKGLELFLEAASQIHRTLPETRFLICGGEIDGHAGYEALLREKTRSLGIDNAVLFTGWRYRHRDIPEVYGALEVSVQCPTYPEPYGLANVEAMASGVPVVAAAHGGPTELCVNGETALLVSPQDPRAAAEATLALLKDSARAKEMGEAGRRRVERLFDRRRCVRELEGIYQEILKN